MTTQAPTQTRPERLAIAREIERRADDGGTLQASDMFALAPAQPTWHTAMHMQRAADLLGVRAELDAICA